MEVFGSPAEGAAGGGGNERGQGKRLGQEGKTTSLEGTEFVPAEGVGIQFDGEPVPVGYFSHGLHRIDMEGAAGLLFDADELFQGDDHPGFIVDPRAVEEHGSGA